jgi:transcriptional regulator with XRE-family HTH domain
VRTKLEGNQSAVARRLGVSQTAWNHYERGTRDIDLDVLASFCRTFGVSADWVLLGDLMALDKRLIAKMVRAHPELADGAAPPMLPLDAEPPSGRR